jgi:hypothetical protein
MRAHSEAIQAALITDTDADAQKAAEQANGVDCYQLLRELAGTLKTEQARVIDSALEELRQIPLDAHTRESPEKISDHVLMAEFKSALEIAKTLF